MGAGLCRILELGLASCLRCVAFQPGSSVTNGSPVRPASLRCTNQPRDRSSAEGAAGAAGKWLALDAHVAVRVKHQQVQAVHVVVLQGMETKNREVTRALHEREFTEAVRERASESLSSAGKLGSLGLGLRQQVATQSG